MDCETNNYPQRKRVIRLTAKPIGSEVAEGGQNIFYSMANGCFCLVDIENGKVINQSLSVHQNRIGSIRNKDNLLITGGYDNTVKLFDTRNWSLIHTFQRIPSKFNCLDKSEHILTGATGSNIVFWDLRKMKQRSEFKESFNGQITYIRFEDEVSTNLLGCSIDGMINMFDLTQPNEEQAFSWCYKIIESPVAFSTARQGRTLVRTMDHNLFKIQEGDLFGKVDANNPENPKHILHSTFTPNTDFEVYEYFTWSPNMKVVELWRGKFFDKSNDQKCESYLHQVSDVEIFNVLFIKQNKCVGVYADEEGNIFADKFTSEKKYHHHQMTNDEAEKEIAGSKKIWNFSKKSNNSNNQGQKVSNSNGYMLEKPVSSFAKHKKYKPY